MRHTAIDLSTRWPSTLAITTASARVMMHLLLLLLLLLLLMLLAQLDHLQIVGELRELEIRLVGSLVLECSPFLIRRLNLLL
jgi:hypothetical protein